MATPRTVRTQTVSTPAVRDRLASPPVLWDPVVRLSHWGIAVSVLGNALMTEGGSLAHVLIGWTAMAMLVLRLVWGVLGPREARFSAFPPNPAGAVAHLRRVFSGDKPRDYPSHNPAGALMVYVFWLALAVVVATGLVMTGGATPMQVAADKAAVASGDWAALVRDGDTDQDSVLGEAAEEVHEVAANLLLILAALHVAGVFVEGRLLRRNLLAPMLFGAKGDRRK